MYANPYQGTDREPKHWLKANFHAHAGTGKETCGAYEIDDVVALYKEHGYDVLTLSNHDIFSDTAACQDKFDIVMFNGFEYSTDPHMLCIRTKGLITGSHQEAVFECARQGGFTVLCHPNWQRKGYWSPSMIDALTGYCGIEIYNGIIFELSGTGLATDTWDRLLSQGKQVWGFGSDDFHRWYNLARAWNVIFSPTRHAVDIQASIEKGAFYVSTGLILKDFAFSEETLRVKADSKDTYIRTYRYVFVGKGGRILDEQVGAQGIYHFHGEETYVRVQVVSEHGAMLWTQPIHKVEGFTRP
jgi:hypothetical protein